MIRVLFAEDSAIVRKGVVGVLQKEPDLEVVAEAENGAIALHLLQDGLKADVLLTDFNMPKMNGLELVQHIKTFDLNLPAIILTMHANTGFMEKALAAGARGYLLKNGDMEELVDCIREVYNGQLVIGQEFK